MVTTRRQAQGKTTTAASKAKIKPITPQEEAMAAQMKGILTGVALVWAMTMVAIGYNWYIENPDNDMLAGFVTLAMMAQLVVDHILSILFVLFSTFCDIIIVLIKFFLGWVSSIVWPWGV